MSPSRPALRAFRSRCSRIACENDDSLSTDMRSSKFDMTASRASLAEPLPVLMTGCSCAAPDSSKARGDRARRLRDVAQAPAAPPRPAPEDGTQARPSRRRLSRTPARAGSALGALSSESERFAHDAVLLAVV